MATVGSGGVTIRRDGWDGCVVPLPPGERDHRLMRSPVRRPVLIGLVVALAAGLLPLASVAATTGAGVSVASAEQTALSLTNARRSNAGLITLRADARLFALARERAEYMARTDTFSHTQSDGTNVFDMLSADGIAWYGAGEIIAWNTAAALDYSATYAVKGWMDSPGHRAIIMSTGYNYVGFGLAISPETGRRYWAGVYLKGPDRTGAWAKIRRPPSPSWTRRPPRSPSSGPATTRGSRS